MNTESNHPRWSLIANPAITKCNRRRKPPTFYVWLATFTAWVVMIGIWVILATKDRCLP